MFDEHRGRPLPAHLVRQILRLHRNGMNNMRIAHVVGVHRATVIRYVSMTVGELSKILSESGCKTGAPS